MATKKKADVYTPQAEIVKITATSRCSVKVRDSYYTVEYAEERVLPEAYELLGVDIVKERNALWNTVNEECDNQIADILKDLK